jgi:hypothetical protein
MNPRTARRILGLVILLISLALLVWGLWPMDRISRILPVSPMDMQLPTPESFLPLIWWVS